MSTQAQAIANQANAQKSTGPITETGKAISSINRRNHGLGGKFTVLPCESQQGFDALLGNLDMEFQPGTPSEVLLIEQMAESRWTRDRALRLQQGTLDPSPAKLRMKRSSPSISAIDHSQQRLPQGHDELLKLRKIKMTCELASNGRSALKLLPFLLGIKDRLLSTKIQAR